MLQVFLNGLIRELASDQTLSVEDGVLWVTGNLIFCCVSDESLLFGEGDVGGGGVVTLIVRDDFDFVVLPYSNAGVGGSEIDSNGWCY